MTSITFIFFSCSIQFTKKYRRLAPSTFYDNEQTWTMENSHFHLSFQWYENIGSQISYLKLFSQYFRTAEGKHTEQIPSPGDAFWF